MSYGPPIRNTAYVFAVGLRSQADTKVFQANPTLAAGDFQVSIDGGALANLASLPVVSPASGKLVLISLTAAEMTGDNITVLASDAAGAEWSDEVWNIQPQTEGVVQRAQIMGLKTEMRGKFEEVGALVATRFEMLRVAVLDLEQAILRGKG